MRTAQWTTHRITSHSHGDCPQMAIADVHRTYHINIGQMYEEDHYTAFPTPKSACPHRGRKRLSGEATLHTILALEWPELVQIGRCKVRWLPSAAKKRNLTSFYSEKAIYTTVGLIDGVLEDLKGRHNSSGWEQL